MAISTDITLFSAQASDANSPAADWPGGRGAFTAFGTFGGGVLKLQWSPDSGTTWLDVDKSGEVYVTFIANGAGGFELPTCQIRAVLTGATAASVSAKAAITRAS